MYPTETRSDAELLAAHVAGDRYAFAELFGRHHAQLGRMARARCRCPEDAADALQEAMLAVHRRAHSFRQTATVSSWLHRIVLNACVDRLRHNRIRQAAAADAALFATVVHDTPLDTVLTVRGALAALPEGQRAVVTAVDMDGYSIADAALLLGIPEGTVKSRAARGRARLAAALA